MTTCSTGPCWTASSINTSNDFVAECVGAINGVWVVGGRNNTNGDTIVQYSTDTISWTQVNFGNLGGVPVKLLATGNNIIIGMVNAVQHIQSTDGINWTVQQHWDPIFGGGFAGDVPFAFGNGYFIYRSSDTLAYSTDGINWGGTLSTGIGGYMNRNLTYGNGLYVGVGSSGFCYTPNVATPMTAVPYANFFAGNIAAGNGIFISTETGLGASSNVYISSDGINWSTIPNGLPAPPPGGGGQTWWNSLVFSQDRFLISKTDSNVLAVSSDGVNWTYTTGDSLFDSAANVGMVFMSTDDDGLYTAVTPFSGLAQTGVCPCVVPGDYWVKLSGVTLSGVSIGTQRYLPSNLFTK